MHCQASYQNGNFIAVEVVFVDFQILTRYIVKMTSFNVMPLLPLLELKVLMGKIEIKCIIYGHTNHML